MNASSGDPALSCGRYDEEGSDNDEDILLEELCDPKTIQVVKLPRAAQAYLKPACGNAGRKRKTQPAGGPRVLEGHSCSFKALDIT